MRIAEHDFLLVDDNPNDECLTRRAPCSGDALSQVALASDSGAAPAYLHGARTHLGRRPEEPPQSVWPEAEAAPAHRSVDAAAAGRCASPVGPPPGPSELGGEIGHPFQSTSGVIGKDVAVTYMRAGVQDFIREDLLVGLTTSIKRQLLDVALRAEQSRIPEGLRCAEEALLRSERLRAIGQMAAGIAHDLKNLLNPLHIRLELLDRQVRRDDPDAIHRNVEEMQGIVQTGVETIERLQAFIRHASELRSECIDVNHVCHEAIELARPRMTGRCGALCWLVEEFGTPPHIQGNRSEIISALVNLVVNAIDAMPGGGTITVRTEASQRGAMIQVRDDGPGMAPEVEKHIFEPFFSTKGEAGTGLGLAMVYRTVLSHSGTISLSTQLGKGTTFSLWFPALH